MTTKIYLSPAVADQVEEVGNRVVRELKALRYSLHSDEVVTPGDINEDEENEES